MQVSRIGPVNDDVAPLRCGLDHLRAIEDQHVEFDRHRVQCQAPGLDLRQIQHLVDQIQQMVSGLQGFIDEGPVSPVECLIQLHQLCKTQDGVERCSQLMAHARQELALGAVGALRFVISHHQLAGAGLHLFL